MANERFEFIKEKITSHYAFVQLDALYIRNEKESSSTSYFTKKIKAEVQTLLRRWTSAFSIGRNVSNQYSLHSASVIDHEINIHSK